MVEFRFAWPKAPSRKRTASNCDEIAPTPEDFIRWLEEEAFKCGEIGFSTDNKFDISLFSYDPDPVTHSTCVAPTVASGVGSMLRMWEREEYIFKKILKHKDVVKQAQAIIDSRLLTTGMTEERIKDLNRRKVMLREKVAELYNLQHPRPKSPERIKIILMRRTELATDNVDLYLSMDDSWCSVKSQLDGHSGTMSGKGEYLSNLAEGPWMYQLAGKGLAGKVKSPKLSEIPRKTIIEDADWRDLIRILRQEGSDIPTELTAYVFQESTLRFSKENHAKAEEEEKELASILDENGNPYWDPFQPLDWDNLFKKHFPEAAVVEQEKEVVDFVIPVHLTRLTARRAQAQDKKRTEETKAAQKTRHPPPVPRRAGLRSETGQKSGSSNHSRKEADERQGKKSSESAHQLGRDYIVIDD